MARISALALPVWHGMRRLLHAYRHRRAIARLRRLGQLRSVLVVCRGNVCRSPYLAALLRQSLTAIDVSSAGFVAAGIAAPEHAVAIATRRGLDLSSHRSRILSPELIQRADVVIVMDPHQAHVISQSPGMGAHRVIVAGDLDPLAADTRVIRDPWQQSLEVFEASYARLERCADTALGVIRRQD